MSDPSGTLSETSSRATCSPKRLETSRTSIAIGLSSFLRSSSVMVPMTTIAIIASSTEAAYAPVRSKAWKRSSTCRVSVSVWPESLPETTAIAPNSPSARAVVRITP